ncbi:hypothetical protein T492DRAFT_1024334 [Pavlovales sp. CCMP2436]|nr:hypothetical protein T492DRAFT_1024334 [Pavlovales sp. CCMP2436]
MTERRLRWGRGVINTQRTAGTNTCTSSRRVTRRPAAALSDELRRRRGRWRRTHMTTRYGCRASMVSVSVDRRTVGQVESSTSTRTTTGASRAARRAALRTASCARRSPRKMGRARSLTRRRPRTSDVRFFPRERKMPSAQIDRQSTGSSAQEQAQRPSLRLPLAHRRP